MSFTIFKQQEQNRVSKAVDSLPAKASRSLPYEPSLYAPSAENSVQEDESAKHLSGSDAIVMTLNVSGKIINSVANLKLRGNSNLLLEQCWDDLAKLRQRVLEIPAQLEGQEQNLGRQNLTFNL